MKFLPFLIGLFTHLSAEVLLFTYSYNRPDFIEIQAKTFKKFLKDDYRFVVFNDARDVRLSIKIEETCRNLGIQCITIPQEIHERPYLKRIPWEEFHDAAVRNCNVVMYSLDHYGFKHDDIVVLLDSDLFLIRDFSIRKYMENCDIAGLAQSRGPYEYLWIGLVFMNMHTMPRKTTIDFNCGKIGDFAVDAGGKSHYYLKNNPSARVKYMGLAYSYKQDPNVNQERLLQFITESNNQNMELMLDQTFLHYRGGTNWDKRSNQYHNDKTKVLNDFINDIIK